MKKYSKKIKKNSGAAMLLSIISFLFISLAIISGLVSPSIREFRNANISFNSKQSYFLAESGSEDATYRIFNNMTIGNSETLTLNSNSATTTITTLLGNIKEINSTGDVSNYQRTISLTLSTGTGASFNYGVQVGSGGLEMSENSEIIGNIYSNGGIFGSSGSKISGDAIVAGNIEESIETSSTNCLQDQIVGQANPQIDFAQSFIAPSSDALAKISLYLKKVGSPASRTVKIVTDDNGFPNDNSFASATLNKDLVTTSYGWIDVTFSSPPVLVSGNTYWIILDAKKDNNKYWIWCNDTNGGYSNGMGKYSKDWDDDPWTPIVGDLNFKTYFGAGISSLDGVIVQGDAKANNITNSEICGDAYYQSIDANSLSFLNSPTTQVCGTPTTDGTAYPGSPDPPVENMAISQANIGQWKIDAQIGGTISGNYNVTNDAFLGPKEITGDLLMANNNKTLTITGTIYVQGNIDINNGSTIRCDVSYGASSCLIVVDGWIHSSNNGTFAGSGTEGSFLMLLTTLPCDGSFSSGCTHHKGAIDVHNNATGVIFYAQNGKVNLHNGVNVTEVTAYKLSLDNNATITYDQGLINANFSSGPSGGYSIDTWQETE